MDSWIHDESSQVQSIIEYLKRRDFVDDEKPRDYGCTHAILTYFYLNLVDAQGLIDLLRFAV